MNFFSEDAGGIEEISHSDNLEEKKICLSDKDILRLAEIGVYLEKRFGSPRDVEWAIYQGKIYLLQARPVTTGAMLPEEQLTCEFDTATVSDSELMTTANIGEMMPGAVTPLTLSTFVRDLDFAFNAWFESAGLVKKINPVGRFIGTFKHNLFINLHVSFFCAYLKNIPNKMIFNYLPFFYP